MANMLIRSQTGLSLVGFNDLKIVYENYRYLIELYNQNTSIILAEYNRRSKAIEVLDMIQSAYDYVMEEQQNFTFKMPQDNED